MAQTPFKTGDSPYRNSNNVLLLRGLFVETSSNPDSVIYTLKDHDYKGYPSLKKLYLDTNDITEYTFATTYLESWTHWKLLSETTWFAPMAEVWREELELKNRAEALAAIISKSKTNDKEAFQAAKYVADKGWDKSAPKSTKGRPSKADIARAAHEIAEDHSQIEQDYERLKLVK